MDLRVAAYAVIVDARGMLLAHWHDGPRAAWTLPGGGLEAGEDRRMPSCAVCATATGFGVVAEPR
jgi:ADP-ribose pyrophosphatase YjhB (NUDIX family)